MSEILSEGTKKIKVVTTKEITGVKCDICGKVIPVGKGRYDECEYYDVMTGHSDWGNDSCDSVEHRDVCPDCLVGFVADYFKNNEYGSAYMNIDTEYVLPNTREFNGKYISLEGTND